MPTYTYTPRVNGLEYEPGATIEVDGDTARFSVASNVKVEGISLNSGKWIQASQSNGEAFLDLPMGKYWDVLFKHAGGKSGGLTCFTLVKRAISPPMQIEVATKPRPTFTPGGHTLAANLDKPGMSIAHQRLTIGGETVGPDGTKYPSAGYGYQISANDCTIRDVTCTVPFSEYFLYVRPGITGALLEDIRVVGGTNFEAILRNAGGNITIRRSVFTQNHTGIDNKRARTVNRGPGNWIVEDCTFAGGTCGAGNPMARLNAGQDLGFGEFQLGRGTGDMSTSEGGQIIQGKTPELIKAGVQAAIDARAAGKSREQIVYAAALAAQIIPDGTHISSALVLDTLWNRERMLGQRGTITYRRCDFAVSTDGVPVAIEIQAGNQVLFEDCRLDAATTFRIETSYPDSHLYETRHPTNRDWTLPDDVVRPTPVITTINSTHGGKPLAFAQTA